MADAYRLEHSIVVLLRVHSRDDCPALDDGGPCPVHAPTNHRFRGWTQLFDPSDGTFWRVCPDHGVARPDPDDPANVADLPLSCTCTGDDVRSRHPTAVKH